MSFSQWKQKKQSPGNATSNELVSTTFLETSPGYPLVYRCNVPNLDLSNWYQKNETDILQNLEKYGALLFRGFDVHNQESFQRFVAVGIKKTAQYIEGATPRTNLNNGIYTATEFPADQEIALHNELSYVTHPPKKLAFCCLQAPESGGQTQIADVSSVLQRIDQEVIESFARKGGWMLRRNYGNGFGPSIEKAFGTGDIDEINAYAQQADLKVIPISETRLATEQVRKSVHQHPVTGQQAWFNHISFWHPSSLCPKVRAKMELDFSLEEFPYSTWYGDGSVISDDVIQHIRQAYKDEETQFDWNGGDVMLLDNWKVAHGRKPFTGARRVLVSMG